MHFHFIACLLCDLERIEELRKLMAEARSVYMRDKEDLCLVQNGQADDKLQELIHQIQELVPQSELFSVFLTFLDIQEWQGGL